MKVLMITTWYSPRDAEVLTDGVFHYEQSMALKKYIDVALYFPFDNSEEKGFYKNDERGLLTYRSVPNKNNIVSKIISVIKNTRRVIRDYKPDIIHAHVASAAGVIAAFFGKIYGIPVVITEHNPIELSGFEKKFNRWRVAYAYRNSVANVCVSNDSKNRLSEIFKKIKFRVIYNGVIDPETVSKLNEKNEYAVSGFINAAIVAAFYSKDIKGYQYLIPAIKTLKEKGEKIKLHICGGGDYLEYYKKMASDLGVEDDCIFYGQCDREKVYQIVSEMDFNISSSIFECSGVSVQEAMLLGKPLVVTKSGGANSLCTDDTAIVVDRESTEALVNGILQMREALNKQPTRFDSEKIRLYAEDNFEIDHVSRRYVKLYRKVLKYWKEKRG